MKERNSPFSLSLYASMGSLLSPVSYMLRINVFPLLVNLKNGSNAIFLSPCRNVSDTFCVAYCEYCELAISRKVVLKAV